VKTNIYDAEALSSELKGIHFEIGISNQIFQIKVFWSKYEEV